VGAEAIGAIENLDDVYSRAGAGHLPIACTPLSVVRAAEQVLADRSIRVTRHIVIVPTSGTGTHVVDNREYAVELGCVVHVLPGQAQRWVTDADFDGWMLAIESFVCPPGLFDLARPTPVVRLGPSIDIASALVCAFTDPKTLPPKSQERLRISMASVLLELIAAVDYGPEIPVELDQEHALVADFRRELEFHYLETRSVSDYASLVGCSAKTLTRATKRVLAQTPKQMIDARVTYAAIRLLVNTDISINWISTKLGFTQQSNFAKFFCRQVDMTPAAYRIACNSSGTILPTQPISQ